MMKFAKTHEWAQVDGDVVTVGITDFAVEQLGDVVFVELPAVGSSVSVATAFGEIESVKAASELISPVDGEVVEVNEDLENDFDVLKDDAFGAGWMIRIKAADMTPLEALLDDAEYRAFATAE